MSDCPYEPIGGNLYRCPRCGHQTRRPYPKPPRRACQILGLGDRAEVILTAWGMSKRDWRRLLVYLRLIKPSENCGCAKRQEKLNRIGDNFLRWWRSLFA